MERFVRPTVLQQAHRRGMLAPRGTITARAVNAMHWILDCIYLVVGACLLPYWLWRLPRGRRYRAGLLQRLGFVPALDPARPRLWIHCASVGEASVPER